MPQVESYRGRHADFYDLFYAGKPYAQESEVVSSLLKSESANCGIRMLEVACGTARHAIEFARLGHHVTGLDYSSDMIRVGRQRTLENPSIVLYQGDMRLLDFATGTFDASVCLFDSIGYLLTNDSISGALSEIHRVLKPGGVFIAEFWHAPAMLSSYEPERTRKISLENSEIVRISRTRLDPLSQTATVEYEIAEFDKAGRELDKLHEAQTNRFFQCQEMRLFFENAAFNNVRFVPAFDVEAVIQLDTWHVLAIGTKK